MSKYLLFTIMIICFFTGAPALHDEKPMGIAEITSSVGQVFTLTGNAGGAPIAAAGQKTNASTRIFQADIAQGTIGTENEAAEDNVYDNIFHIQLPAAPDPAKRYYLSYQLFGVTGPTGIARSVNNSVSSGGAFVAVRNSWSDEKEVLAAGELRAGDNVIRFGKVPGAHVRYIIKNLRIEEQSGKSNGSGISIDMVPVLFGDHLYVKGTIAGSIDSNTITQVYVENHPVIVTGNEFELVLNNITGAQRSIALTARTRHHQRIRKSFAVHFNTRPFTAYGMAAKPVGVTGTYHYETGLALDIAGKNKGVLTIPAQALPQTEVISVTPLRSIDLPLIQPDMVNVTAGYAGYRFLPHGTKFGKAATVCLGFDSTLIPEGYTSADIKTYYFDEYLRRWFALPIDSISAAHCLAYSKTTHFTDMINAIIKVPESPQTQGYTPTSIKDLKAADPSSNIVLINPPAANSTGAATLNYELKLPPGIRGLQPKLAMSYNNQGGSSWVGQGWSLSVPDVRIETRWGAPRYDKTYETESYILAGQPLAPIVNRTALKKRTRDHVFTQRVEGSFYRIIRHGYDPSEYWWEAVTKEGVHNYYGGTPSSGLRGDCVLKDDENNVAYWALAETRDPDDNFVQYDYTTVEDAGVPGGSIKGRQLYISRVTYTGHGTTTGAYSVDFVRDRTQQGVTQRKDIEINGTLGFKMVSADLLKQVNISFQGKPVRSYIFSYKEGAFFKTLLDSMSELDAAGHFFYGHSFDYYDDVDYKNNYQPLNTAKTWNTGIDNIKGDLINPVGKFTGEGFALSTAKSSSIGAGITLSIGPSAGGFWSKLLSVGVTSNYTEDNSEGLVAMVDINGDGLPDKIFKKDGLVYYRANTGGTVRAFGDKKTLSGITDFSKASTTSTTFGTQEVPGPLFLSSSSTDGVSTTSVYLTDFNADGLMDIVSNGTVYFNHLENGEPVFSPDSGPTPNPIIIGNTVDKSFLTKDTGRQQKQEQQFPLQDVVRMWQAPMDGSITITGNPNLIPVFHNAGTENKHKDGVRVSVQKNRDILWSDNIAANNYAASTLQNLQDLPVQQGDRFYFRVESKYNGVDDIVHWDPVINYTMPALPARDANHNDPAVYKASADYILDTRTALHVFKQGQVVIKGQVIKNVLSDTVTALLVRRNNNTDINVFNFRLMPGDVITLPTDTSFEVIAGDELRFIIESNTPVNRTAVKWQAHYSFSSFADGTPALDNNGNAILQGDALIENANFNQQVYAPEQVTAYVTDTVRILPSIAASLAGSLIMTVKGIDTLYEKRMVTVQGGISLPLTTPISISRKTDQPIFVEFTTADQKFATSITSAMAVFEKDTLVKDLLTNQLKQITISFNKQAGLYTEPANNNFGPLYRGWGIFAYKGDINPAPIDESKLNLTQFSQYSTDPNDYSDPSALTGASNPMNNTFVPLLANATNVDWTGYDTAIYVAADRMASSRLFMHDVFVDQIMEGQAASAVSKISVSNAESESNGVSFIVGVTKSDTKSTSRTTLDMMDLNGDRYPDIVSEQIIQFTQPNSALDNSVTKLSLPAPATAGTSSGGSVGSSSSQVYNDIKTISGSRTSEQQASCSFSVSGNTGEGENHATNTWMDINADGLPDMVFNDGQVALNLGYHFAPKESWHLTTIDNNTDKSESGGAGFSLDAASAQAGFSLNRGDSKTAISYEDINGDGLPDRIEGAGSLDVSINTGNGFVHLPKPWNGYDYITGNISTGESINAAFTICVPLIPPIVVAKLCINPSFNTGHGVSRRQFQIMDVDGDGYPDFLRSDNDQSLVVSTSTIGRTNMLRSVQRPMKGSFTIDYIRTGNTYAMPQNKWVMSNVVVSDGVPGDGVDTSFMHFVYEEGIYERREREFYGFGRVSTEQLNADRNHTVYRRQVQEYATDSYYKKGLLNREWLEDAAGHKFTETVNTYVPRPVQEESIFPALTQTDKNFYEGQASPGVSTSIYLDYDALGNTTSITDIGDGSARDLLKAKVIYEDFDIPYIKSLAKSIEVTTDIVRRKRTAKVNEKGHVTHIEQFLEDGKSAVTDMTFDAYGNLESITKPENYKADRMFYKYTYDNTVHSYNTGVTDAYGYSSSSTYNYLFGTIATTKSMNEEEMHYAYDDKGRLTTITGPYEIKANKPFTIAQEFFPAASIPYAITRHYDPQYDSTISIITFMDGLGRPIQVKKQSALYVKGSDQDALSMVVSGKIIYDAFGRADSTLYPTVEKWGAQNNILSTVKGLLASAATYDVQDRQLSTVLADGATTVNVYTAANQLLTTHTTDALGNAKEIVTDVKKRQRYTRQFGGPQGTITTTFVYDALDELLNVVDTKGNTTQYSYDNLGRKLSMQHPDAGLTTFRYDLAGNMLEKTTAEIRKEIPTGGSIRYGYEFERLTDIDYPRYYQNKVKYTYGKPGMKARTGRLILTEDASGGQEFFYGPLGEVIKTIRTVVISPIYATTYVSEQTYDTWNRITKMVYPDGEAVTYYYNKGGNLQSLVGTKLGDDYNYVTRLGYDEYDKRVFMQYGNGATNEYVYDPLRRRLENLTAKTKAGHAMMDNSYKYDPVSNILNITNKATADTSQLGGSIKQDYDYDKLYRLVNAKGIYRGKNDSASYNLSLTYDNLYNISSKSMIDSRASKSYHADYLYQNNAPHQATDISGVKYSYDANGNQLGNIGAENFWDEENRLIAVITGKLLCQYTYDASGERVVKSSGPAQGLWLNGAPAGTIKHNDNYTVYVSPYLVTRFADFTKHYYIGTERIVSKMGNGKFINFSFPSAALTAGNVDYVKRAADIEKAETEFYAGLHGSPASPTDKNYWLRPENSGGPPAPVFADTSAAIPVGWPSPPAVPSIGQPIVLPPVPGNDDVHAGYGFDGTGHFYEKNQYFYHPDHLGSTSYITNALGDINQHLEYSAFGETFFEEHKGSTTMPYLFNAKERDEETGLYYYGARYYNPRLSLWISTDPKMEKYQGLSPYNFNLENPVKLIDPDGKSTYSDEKIGPEGSPEVKQWRNDKHYARENQSEKGFKFDENKPHESCADLAKDISGLQKEVDLRKDEKAYYTDKKMQMDNGAKFNRTLRDEIKKMGTHDDHLKNVEEYLNDRKTMFDDKCGPPTAPATSAAPMFNSVPSSVSKMTPSPQEVGVAVGTAGVAALAIQCLMEVGPYLLLAL
ncbi:MAG: RHS repeat-associated core domain-containing protein [Chitinophagaceae bacterium]